MIKQYFQQAWAQLKQQPVVSAVNVAGTALAIFLIMLVVMIQEVQVAPFAPESNRDRFLHYRWCSIKNERDWGPDDNSNGAWSWNDIKGVFGQMKTPEAVSAYHYATTSMPVSVPGQPAMSADVLPTDANFWRVFDFAFLGGKPYDQATFDAGLPVAVLTRSVARALFGTEEATGREFLLSHAPYRVCGVVNDVSTLATTAYGQVWIPFTSADIQNESWAGAHMGPLSVVLLAKSRSDFDAIRSECDRNLLAFNQSMAEEGYEIFSRNRPYDQEKNVLATGANWEPDVKAARRSRLVIYLILLIVPAINLSSMTQSRLRQRISEIGVRRAFGCTRPEIAGQILAENMIVTLMAGIVGFLLSVAFAYLGDSILFAQPYSSTLNPPTIDASILIHGSTFGMALLFCFILNLLSTGIPAWRAARQNIVEAINGKH